MNHAPDWHTIQEVQACQTLAKVNLLDDVALRNHSDSDWTTGLVTEISTYKDRSTRWVEKRRIMVKPHDGSFTKAYYEMNVAEILFKD
jgi:hypothetical protein